MNYYNEFDHNAAEWLRELIAEGLIPPGDVDERSITDVTATDLLGYTQCHFFAGIGGWSFALRLAGWPDDRPVWTGSCPCQCFSTAGKQRGFADERDLWPVFADLIRQCRPEFVLGEQVENAIRHGWLDRVYTDMEREGYAVGAHVLGAHSVGAPHRRYRLYWGAVSVAEHSDGGGCGGRNDGNQTGRGREVQIAGLGDDSGVDEAESIGRGIRNAADVWQTDGEVNASANASCGGDRVAHMQGDGRVERRAEPDGRGASSGCGNIGMSDRDGSRLEGRNGSFERSVECAPGADGLASLSPWSGWVGIYCRDGKVRRVPAESLLFSVADGLPEEVDGSGIAGISEVGGFPLTTQKEGRAMLLKGYGNAIVPQVAAAFIAGFEKSVQEDCK